MSITFIGTTGGAALVRNHSYRVVIRGALDLTYLVNLLDWRGFASRVEQWRADVASGRAGVAAIVSAPAISGDGPTSVTQRAVFDVQILGGTVGEMSVSQWGAELDRLVSGLDVVSIARISAPSESERGAVLATEQARARDPFGLRSTGQTLIRLATLALVIAGVYVLTNAAKFAKGGK